MPAQRLYVAHVGGSAKESAMDISRRFYFEFTSSMRKSVNFMAVESSVRKVISETQ